MLRSVVVTASFLFLIGVSFVSAFNVSAVTGNTQVQTLVCDGSASATLTIGTPLSDSVVSSMPLTISGTVNNVTQIDITVDGNYSSTVPLSAGQTAYSTQVSLTAGTHTIKLTGNDVCGVQNPERTIVITYQQDAIPGNGNTTPTNTPGIGPRATSPRAPANGEPLTNFEKLPIIRSIAPLVKDLGQAIDFDETARDGGLFVAMLRFALFTLGLGLLLFALTLLILLRKLLLREAAVEGYIEGKETLSDPKLKDHIIRNAILMRSVGVLFIALAFIV